MHRGRLRRQGERLAVILERLGGATKRKQRATEVFKSAGVLSVGGYRLPVKLDRIGVAALGPEHEPEDVQRIGIVALATEHAAAGRFRLGESPLSVALRRARKPKLRQLPQHIRSEEHTSELQSRRDLVCRLLLEKKNIYSTCVLFYIF